MLSWFGRALRPAWQRHALLVGALLASACIPQVITGCSSNDAKLGEAPSSSTAGSRKPPAVKFLVTGAPSRLYAIVTEKTSKSAVLYVRVRRTGNAPKTANGLRTQAITEGVGCEDIQENGTAIPLASGSPLADEEGMTLVQGEPVASDMLRTVYPLNAAGQDLSGVLGDSHTAIAEGCVFDGNRLVGSSVEELADAADDGQCGLPETSGPSGDGSPTDPTGGPSGDGGPPSNPNLRDSCVGKADGVYCSQLDKAAAIICKDGQIASGQQCIDGKVCAGPNGPGTEIVCSAPSSEGSSGGGTPDENAGLESAKSAKSAKSGNAAPFGVKTSISLRPRAFPDGVYKCDAKQLKGKKAYTDACEKALGELPMFKKKPDGSHERFSCVGNADMQIIPVQRTESGKLTTIDKSVTGALDATQKAVTEKCDQPAWLGYGGGTQCAPYTRAGVFKSSSAEFVVICRRYKARAIDDTDFDDVNIIGHNKSTGDTCFWNTHLSGVDTKKGLPHPAEDVANDAKWMTVGDLGSTNCVSCHDADAWMHSPWIDQVNVVPSNPKGKYRIVQSDSLEKEASGGTQWNALEKLDEPDAKPCVSCHRIGKYNGVSLWTPRSTGQSIKDDGWWAFASDYAKEYEQNRWMPEASAPDKKDWDTSEYAKAVKRIAECAADRTKCKWSKI